MFDANILGEIIMGFGELNIVIGLFTLPFAAAAFLSALDLQGENDKKANSLFIFSAVGAIFGCAVLVSGALSLDNQSISKQQIQCEESGGKWLGGDEYNPVTKTKGLVFKCYYIEKSGEII